MLVAMELGGKPFEGGKESIGTGDRDTNRSLTELNKRFLHFWDSLQGRRENINLYFKKRVTLKPHPFENLDGP